MRSTLLAFLGLAFAAYWLWTTDNPEDRQIAMAPVLPSLLRSGASGIEKDGSLLSWVAEETSKVGRMDRGTSDTTIRLKRKALSFSNGDLESLKSISFDQSVAPDERLFAVYMIGMAESAQAREQLKEIARSPVPPTNSERAHSDEVIVRANALESVLKRLSSTESNKYLTEVLAQTTDPALLQHIRYWLAHL